MPASDPRLLLGERGDLGVFGVLGAFGELGVLATTAVFGNEESMSKWL